MVMDAPSPQCVGREFVRQYYTLLNKAPLHLHRFYNHNSSFLHGGIDPPGQETKPVVGQQAIHQKIMQLNFKDCHAKIRQVDSHETLDSGVVVQVSGELSNNGQPMRSFMQTFVLAPQSPKKYYVRNDIFRYQDVFYADEDEVENDNAVISTDPEEITSTQKNVTNTIQESENVGYYEPENLRNGSVHASESVSKFVPPPQPVETTESPQPALDVESRKSWEDEDEEEEEEEEEELEETNITIERTENNAASETESISTPAMSQEMKTYANMVSKNTPAGGPSSVPSSSTTTSPVTSQMPVASKNEQTPAFHKGDGGGNAQSHYVNTPQMGSSFSGPRDRQSRSRMNSGRGGGGGGGGGGGLPRYENRDNTAQSPEDFDSDRRKFSFHYPDNHQLFVGNLTHSITEDDLRNHFSKFGTVLDMRINTKLPQKTAGGKIPPNYGFIVFEGQESVQKVLDSRPIFFKEHRLNVEEKKRPKDPRLPPGDNRIGPGGRGGLANRMNMTGRGGRGGMLGSQGTGRGDSRGGMKSGGYPLRR